MNPEVFSKWLASLSIPARIRALTLIYSSLTVYTRELFLPDRAKGNERVILDMLHGLNEVHHTIANWLAAYATDESKAFPVDVLSQQLLQITKRYRVEGFLTSSIEFAQKAVGSGN